VGGPLLLCPLLCTTAKKKEKEKSKKKNKMIKEKTCRALHRSWRP
jgi:hypothetical protein